MSIPNRVLSLRILSVAVLVFVSLAAHGQYTVGRLDGTIKDASGALISGATVSIRHTGTNAERTFITGTDGYYVFFALAPGTYDLRVEAPQFAALARNVYVHASENVTETIVMQVNARPTALEVPGSGMPLQLNAADAQHSITRTELELTNLPTLGRNMMNVVTLAPGVQPTNNPRGGTTFGGGGSYVIVLGVQSGLISANGGRARATSVQLDYTDANDWEGGGFAPAVQAITPDMLQEFKLLTSNFSAEYGVKSNAQVMMITRSGSNNWHGSIYDFLQNDALNARDYFDHTGNPSPLKQNVYGITMGGPVQRDRTFFFAGYEGRKTRGAGFTTLANVPSDSARARATDPAVIDLMDRYLPHATGPSPDGNPDFGAVAVQIPSPVDNYQFVVKGDHGFSTRHTVSARYLQSTASFVARFPSQNSLPGFDVDNHFELRSASLGDTYVVSPRTVHEVRLAYNHASAMGRPQNDVDTPRFLITGLVNFGALQSVPAGRAFNIYQVSDLISHVQGLHLIKAGGEVRIIRDDSENATNSRGVFTFATLDNFLTGRPTSYTQMFGDTTRAFRTALYGLFVQDDWKVRPTLTLNLGVRWEVQGALNEANELSSVLDPNLPGPIGAAGTGPLGSFRVGGAAVGINPFNIGPRVGFAWNPRNGNFVLRGGYGIYWDSFTFGPLNASRFSPPFNYNPTCPSPSCQFTGANSFDNLLAGTAPVQLQTMARLGTFGDLQNFGSATTLNPKLKNPYVQNVSLGVEYRLTHTLVGSVGYVGTKGTHLTRLVPINSIVSTIAPAISPADELARISQFIGIVSHENGPGNLRSDSRFDQVNMHDSLGSSIYHSLQAEVRKALSHGIQFQASYTWSKSIDDASDFAPTIQANDNSFAQDAFKLDRERAVSNYDIPHRVVVTGIWQIPFFSNLHGAARQLFHGWSFESVNMWQSGLPATLLSGARTLAISDPNNPGQFAKVSFSDVNLDGNLVAAGTDNTRANCAAGASFVLGNPALNRGISQPFLGNDGTCGRNSVRMSSLTNFDWSFLKDFTLRERGPFGSGPWDLQFRAELINIFNIPFKTAQGDAWRSVASPSFGTYNAAGITRRLQFALRMTW